MKESLVINGFAKPYVGLRPFETSESELFFGREEQIKSLLNKLYQTNFVAVVGSSGSGKSSLVKAGLIPSIKAGFLNKADHWYVADFRPGDNPIYYFAKALTEAFNLAGSPVELERAIQMEGSGEVIENVSPYLKHRDSSFLILVDQFEELFTHFKNISEQSALMYRFEFVKILLEIIDTDLPIYVILTMRSDYIGKCNIFHGLAEALSNSQFLVPRLQTAELHQVIEGPIKLFGAVIEPGLTQKILNDLQDGEDQLPILEHALGQLWRVKKSENEITFKDYEATGKLKAALSIHANAIYNEVIEKQPDLESVIRGMFQFIIDFDDEKKEGVRQPRKVHEIQRVTGATFNEVKTIFEAFSVEHACFLYSPSQRELDEFALIDISHESLMREWDLFKKWKEEEERDKRYVERLNDFATEFRERKRGRLQGPELALYANWPKYLDYNNDTKKEKIHYWAKRYQIDFEKVNDYIRISRKKSLLVRSGWWSVVTLILAAIIGFVFDHQQRALDASKITSENLALKAQNLEIQSKYHLMVRNADSLNLLYLKQIAYASANESELQNSLIRSNLKLMQSEEDMTALRKTIARKDEFIQSLRSYAGNDQKIAQLTKYNEELNKAKTLAESRNSKASLMIDSLNFVIDWYKRESRLNYSPAGALHAYKSSIALHEIRKHPLGKGNYDVCLALRIPTAEAGRVESVRYYLRAIDEVGEGFREVSTSNNKFQHCMQVKQNLPIQVVIIYNDKSSKVLKYEW